MISWFLLLSCDYKCQVVLGSLRADEIQVSGSVCRKFLVRFHQPPPVHKPRPRQDPRPLQDPRPRPLRDLTITKEPFSSSTLRPNQETICSSTVGSTTINEVGATCFSSCTHQAQHESNCSIEFNLPDFHAKKKKKIWRAHRFFFRVRRRRHS